MGWGAIWNGDGNDDPFGQVPPGITPGIDAPRLQANAPRGDAPAVAELAGARPPARGDRSAPQARIPDPGRRQQPAPPKHGGCRHDR